MSFEIQLSFSIFLILLFFFQYHVQLASDFAEKFPGMSFRVVDCIKQEAASLDCGPMMLNNILRHIRKIDPMQKFDAGGFRAKMMKMIENGK